MKRIGIISDTHGFFDDKLINFLSKCDEIWHAGDIGNLGLLEKLENFKPLKAVYGNIDDYKVRSALKETIRFRVENKNIIITHIGGYPGKYEKKITEMFKTESPDIFVCGHSHILKVMYDKKYNVLHINPGAAGKSGLHKQRTAIRLIIDANDIRDMEILNIER